MFFANYLYNKFDWKLLISKFEEIFDNKYIYDQGCDWFCVRVLGPMIKENRCVRKSFQSGIIPKSLAARASVVAFVNYTKHSEYKLLCWVRVPSSYGEKNGLPKLPWLDLRNYLKRIKAVMLFIEKHGNFQKKV